MQHAGRHADGVSRAEQLLAARAQRADAPRDDKAYLGVQVAYHFAAGGAAGLQRAQHHRHVARVARGKLLRVQKLVADARKINGHCAPAVRRQHAKAALSGVVAGFAAASGRVIGIVHQAHKRDVQRLRNGPQRVQRRVFDAALQLGKEADGIPCFFTELAQSEVFPAPQLADGFQHNMHLVSPILYGMRRRFASPDFAFKKQKRVSLYIFSIDRAQPEIYNLV